MTDKLDYWKFIAGLGLFLYGMDRLEFALKELAGKKFKLFLKKYTTNRFLAILNGTFATAFLQSSSIVLLMVIAFTGAGVITLSNSLGIILGANLGTTITGWLVSFIGFKINLDSFIFPIVGIGSLGSIFFVRRYYIYHICRLFVAMGLLLMGLEFMKDSMAQLSTMIDLKSFEQYGSLAFFGLGFLVTALIQSSSAMMTITLSALHVNIITLVPAAFIVIGADLGTTITALIASFRGTPVKRRVGLAHFLFNVTTAIMALLIVGPTLDFIKNGFNISDPLYTLVAFHSSFNFLGIIIFLPFLGFFERFLNKFFINRNDHACKFIQKVSTEVPEASLEAIRQELHHFVNKVFRYNSSIIGLPSKDEKNITNLDFKFLRNLFSEEDIGKEYDDIKRIEEELLSYFSEIQKEKLETVESDALSSYIHVLRSGVQSAKSAKGIEHNVKDFHQSIIGTVEDLMKVVYDAYLPVQKYLYSHWEETKEIKETILANQIAYQQVNEWIYRIPHRANDQNVQIATFLNVNREIYSANRLLLEAIEKITGTSLPPQQ